MVKNKISKIIAITIFTLSLMSFVASAVTVYTGSTTNVITSGNLTMKLHDETAGNVEFPSDGIQDVLPGQTIDKIVYIENTCDNEMWVRISLDNSIIADISTGKEEDLDINNIALNFNTVDWTEKDGWYYYNEPLRAKECTEELFSQVYLSPEMKNEYANAEIKIVVNAQAVQTIHNGEKFENVLGWPSDVIDISTLTSTTSDPTNTTISSTPTEIEFTGTEPNFTYTPENTDMFNNFKNIMPGDIIEQKIQIRNSSKDKSVKIYLRAETVSEEDEDFLSNMALAVYNGNKLISDDNASKQGKLNENVLLGTIAPDSKVELTAKLQCNIAMDNEYASDKGEIKWIITTEEAEPAPTDIPQTGDSTRIGLAGIIMSLSGMLFAYTYLARKKKVVQK